MNRFVKLAKEVANALKQLKEIKTIAIYGTIGRDIADKYSDIDLICLCDKVPSQKARKFVLGQLGKIELQKLPGTSNKVMDDFEYKNIEVAIWYGRLSWMIRARNKFKRWGPWSWRVSTEERKNVIGKIYYSKIIYDPYKIFKKLKQGLPKAAPASSVWPLEVLKRTCYGDRGPWGDFLKKAVLRKDPIAVNAEFTNLIELYIHVLHDINGEHYITPKWALKSIRKMKIKPKNCEKRLKMIALLGNDVSSVKKKSRILKSLVDDLNKILKKNR